MRGDVRLSKAREVRGKTWCLFVVLLASFSFWPAVRTVAALESGKYDRRTYYSQPMGQSAWKRPPASVDDFADLVQNDKLNANAAQYAEALQEAGWISSPDPAVAAAFLRGLKEGVVPDTQQYRMGRILRSYRTHASKLNSQYAAVIKKGEHGYFDAQGQLVVRKLCLNVIYPPRRVAVLPTREEKKEKPPAAPLPVPPSGEREAPPTQYVFLPPPQLPPPAREIRQPVSRSRP